jgi:hypothetical protein
MANGDYFSADRLRELIKPIESIRQMLERLARDQNLGLTFHPYGWPGVKISWVNRNGIDCIVSLTMQDDYSLYGLGIAAFKDVANQRYISMSNLESGLKIPFIADSIFEKINHAISICNSKKFEDLSLSNYDKKRGMK